jgi:histidinol-phosphate phosphatase family protein
MEKPKDIEVDDNWTLFLDRDGTINTKLEDDYVKKWSEFEFIPGALESLSKFAKRFARIVIVTNQQGIGKELMTHEDLTDIHKKMMEVIEFYDGRIDQIYYCPFLAIHEPTCRKPMPGMAIQAQKDFPDIDFSKSIMVGDAISDVEFGTRLGMKTVMLLPDSYTQTEYNADLCVSDLEELNSYLKTT